MVMIKDKSGVERYSISTKLNELLGRCHTKINHEDSMVIGIFCGDVGSGKSLAAMKCGHVVDPTIDISRIAFDKDEFVDAVIKNRKKVVVGDEGIALFFSRGSMTKEGRLMAEIMAQCRQKNLCVFICVPELLSIDWLILKAANFVAYVWESKKQIHNNLVTVKGNMALYPALPGNDYKMRLIDWKKKKKGSLSFNKRLPEPYHEEAGNPIGPTYKKPWYPVDEEKYRAKKESILHKYKRLDKKAHNAPKGISGRNKAIRYLRKEHSMEIRDIAKIVGMSKSTVHEILKRGV